MTNIVLLVGNLGADPQGRTTSGGTDVTTFSLGTSRPKRDAEGKTYKDESGFTAKDTEWHRVTSFNGLGRTVAQHARKGMLVSVGAASTTPAGPTTRVSSGSATRSSPTTSSSSTGLAAAMRARPGNRSRKSSSEPFRKARRPGAAGPFSCPFHRRRGREGGRGGSSRERPSVADGAAALKDARYPRFALQVGSPMPRCAAPEPLALASLTAAAAPAPGGSSSIGKTH